MAQAQPERAAHLLGATAALLEAICGCLEMEEQATFDRSVATVRTTLGERQFAVVWAAGQGLSLEQAIAELTFKDEQVRELARQNEALDRTVEELRQQIALLQRRLSGPRSEKYPPDQLFLDDVLKAGESALPAEEPPTVPVRPTVRRKARPHGRLQIPEHIERVDEVLDLPEDQKRDPQTGEELVKLREETSEKLAWKPGQWVRPTFIRPVYVHPDRQSEHAGVHGAAHAGLAGREVQGRHQRTGDGGGQEVRGSPSALSAAGHLSA